METARRIGELEVSVAGLGCNQFGGRLDQPATAVVVQAAIDAGINFFDSTDVYCEGRSEEFLGQAVQGRRDQVVIGSKFGMRPPDGLSGGSPEWVAQAAENSLRRLGTDYIDVYWLHRPDPKTPVEQTLRAMNELVDAGKVREIACSAFSAAQLDEADAVAREAGLRPFVSVQNDYSLVVRDPEPEVLPACERLGLSFVPYFPLASGLLTGKYRRGQDAPVGSRLEAKHHELGDKLVLVEALEAYAQEHGHSITELALSWLSTNPQVVSVIAGATSADQVRANAAATIAWELSDTERSEVAAILAAKS